MKIYNVAGYLIILAYLLACMYSAPAHLGSWMGVSIGAAYLIFCWFMGGLYLADVLHLGIAHRSLDYKEWFMKTVTVVNNTFAIYVDPIAWVNRHRLHHKNSDHEGDPNKISGDGFWRTMYRCMMPYECNENLAGDQILKSRTFRIAKNPIFGILAQAFSFSLLWKLVGSLKFTLVMWVGVMLRTSLNLMPDVAGCGERGASARSSPRRAGERENREQWAKLVEKGIYGIFRRKSELFKGTYEGTHRRSL